MITERKYSSFVIRYSSFESLALFLLTFGVYLRGLAPSIVNLFDDSLEFPLVVHRMAIAHPTGYPLYILLGKLFSLPNPANVAFQLNLMSAFFGALAVSMVYRAGVTIFSPATAAQHAGAWLGALIFGLGPVFFSQATLAEVYTLNAFFIATLFLFALQKRWLWLAITFGFSLTHHRTAILMLPALGIALSAQFPLHRQDGWRQLWRKIPPVKAAIALISPLLLYLYLPLRGAVGSLDGSYQNTWAGFWTHIMGGGYGNSFLLDNPFGVERGFSFYADLLQSEVGWWGLILAILGLGGLILRKRWRELAITGVAFVTFFAFNLRYSVADIEVFFIPIFLILALWAGIGLAMIFSLAENRPRRQLGGAAIIALALLWRGIGVDASRADDWAVHDAGLDALAQPAPNSTVVGILGEMTRLRYFQETQNLRPDVSTIAADLDAERLSVVRNLLENGDSVYLTRELPNIPAEWHLSAAGRLIAVSIAPFDTAPAFDVPMAVPVTPEISLAGYSVSRVASHKKVAPVRLLLVWRVMQSPPADLKVSARLLDADGNVAAVVDGVPVNFAYPTARWQAGDFVSDVYDLSLPDDALGKTFTPLIILYDPANNATEVGRVTLSPIVID